MEAQKGKGIELVHASEEEAKEWEKWREGYVVPDCLQHRAQSAESLKAQATQDFEEIKHLAQHVSNEMYTGGIGGGKKDKGSANKGGAKTKMLGNGEGIDVAAEAEEYFQRGCGMLAGSACTLFARSDDCWREVAVSGCEGDGVSYYRVYRGGISTILYDHPFWLFVWFLRILLDHSPFAVRITKHGPIQSCRGVWSPVRHRM